MTSQVNPNNIDGTFPVAGQDNDSQGFRDNFTNIRNNFTFIKAEVEDLQNKAVLKSALTNTVLSNDFAGNAIVNPVLSSWRESYNNIGAVSGSITVNFSNGNYQKITMAGSTTLNFSFPTNTANQYASVKLWVSNPSASYTLTLPSSCTLGDPDTVAGLSGTSPPIISFNADQIANNTEYLFEFFTFDGGTTIGIKDLIRNRDVDLSGLTIGGNIGISGNLISSGGKINTGFVELTVTNGQNVFANIDFNTFILDSVSSATIANVWFTLPPTAENGREIVISTLAPITACNINADSGSVKWANSNIFSAGNVSTKFIYSASSAAWLKI